MLSPTVGLFQDRPVPDLEGSLAGYAALISTYNLKVPLPERLAFIRAYYKRYSIEGWSIYPLKYKPDETIAGHLSFALKYEGVNLAILNALFQKISPKEIEEWVRSAPVGLYSRRIWFFYEWLTGEKLDLPDANTGNFVEAIDPKLQFAGAPQASKRHRIRNNLPGTPDFCPLVWRTPKIEKFINLNLSSLAHKQTQSLHPDTLARAAAFLLLKDSRASFAIEGEPPIKDRTERWGRAIAQAGRHSLSTKELLRLQTIVIGDRHFIHLGLRQEGGFIGVHERSTQLPLPDHISARWQDLPRLLEGMIAAYEAHKKSQIDPVVLAAVIAFGLVFIHPFADGNGRIHRYLIHHVLSEMGFTPKEIVFPVSSVILDQLDEYRRVLESYSRPRLEFIEWRSTQNGNLEVLNETMDLYRYFDATKMVEFLYECVQETVEKVIPEEVIYLERYDKIKKAINEQFDMPDHVANLLIHFLQQNSGKLSKRAREKEFKLLSQKECETLEKLYKKIFGHEASA